MQSTGWCVSVGAVSAFEEPYRNRSSFQGRYYWLIYWNWLSGDFVWAEPKIDRSLPTADTTLSQDGPGLPCGADVGPVPVWYIPLGCV